MKTHYLHHYRLALAEGHVHFAAAIAALYLAEFGEAIPAPRSSEPNPETK